MEVQVSAHQRLVTCGARVVECIIILIVGATNVGSATQAELGRHCNIDRSDIAGAIGVGILDHHSA